MIYLLLFCLLIIAELIYFRIADRFNIIDKPNERSSHKSITLRGGGILRVRGISVDAAFDELEYLWFVTALSLGGIISFTEYIRSRRDVLLLVIQFSAMRLIVEQFVVMNCESCWINLIALIVCVGVSNAYNFMDGINGITGGYSLAVMIPLMFINARTPFIDPNFLYVVTLSLLVFCFFNFRKKAKCFAGDVGSLSIAFIIIFALGRLILQTGDFTYILFLALYGVDSVLTICHRIMLHENLGQAHRKHAYQLMANELRIPHVVVSSIYMVIQLAISFGLILLPINHWIYAIVVLLLLTFAYLLFMRKYYPLHEAYLKSKQA